MGLILTLGAYRATSVINYSGRMSELMLTDDSPVYHALSARLCQAKSITRVDDRHAKEKLSMSGV